MATAITNRSVLARWMAIPGVLAVVWAWAGGALGEPPVPSLETLLAQGVENHPTVVAAKAKVALAQAELNNARFEVSRQIIAMRGEYDGLENDLTRTEARLNAATQDLEAAKALAAEGSTPRMAVTNADFRHHEAIYAMLDAKARRNSLGMELQRLLMAATDRSAEAPREQPRPPVRPLPGPVVQKMAAALDTVIPEVDFTEVPLKDVVAYLQDVARTPITVDAGCVPLENPVSLKLKGAKLSAALQALEDLCLDTVFVVREYGLLATDKAKAEDQGYVRIRDLGKPEAGAEPPKTGKDLRPPAMAPAQP